MSSLLKNSIITVVLTLFTVFLASAPAIAEQGKKKEEKLPRSGTLSSSFTGGYGGGSVDGVWGGTDQAGDKVAPISGSVSRVGNERWQMRVFNNSEDPYSVSLAVRQVNARGGTTKVDSFSYTLKAGESQERSVPFAAGTTDARLELQNWKNLKKPTKTAEGGTNPEGQVAATAK